MTVTSWALIIMAVGGIGGFWWGIGQIRYIRKGIVKELHKSISLYDSKPWYMSTVDKEEIDSRLDRLDAEIGMFYRGYLWLNHEEGDG